jgi:hypothetical protein
MNDGDWVESCTALVEHWDGRWEIITWTKEKDDVDNVIVSDTFKKSKRHPGKNNTGVPGSDIVRIDPEDNVVSTKI